MRQVLIVNYGEYEFTNFNRAASTLEEEFGYEGMAWGMVSSSGDFEILADFLISDGLSAEVVEG